jgi:FMN-dependent NADH-azoreductase
MLITVSQQVFIKQRLSLNAKGLQIMLLQLDSSPMGDHSISRSLSRHFSQKWLERNPSSGVIIRDLAKTNIPPVTAAWITAAYTDEQTRTPEQKQLLSLSDQLVSELQTADEYVFGVPMHNFSIPATLKLWIDQISRVGKTFAYPDGKPVGLLKGKKATLILASGGVYSPGTAMESFNHVEPYLRSVLGFLGVTDLTFLAAGGTAALRFGQIDRNAFLQPHLDSIEAQLTSVL